MNNVQFTAYMDKKWLIFEPAKITERISYIGMIYNCLIIILI